MKPITVSTAVTILMLVLTVPCHSYPKKNSSVVFEPGPWKPLKSTSSPFATIPLSSAAILNRRGFLNPSATELSSQSFQYARPGTLIKNRDGSSSTFGLDIPDSNLRLLLDIDEMSAKQNHDNFKLKVIERDEPVMHGNNNNNRNKGNKYSVPLRPPVPISQPPLATLVSSPSAFASNSQKYQIGYIRTTDLHSALHSGALPPGSKAYPVTRDVKFSQPLLQANNLVDNMKPESNILLNPSNSLDSQPFVPMSLSKPAQALPLTSSSAASELEPSAQTFSKTNSRPNNKSVQSPTPVSSPVKSLRKSRKLKSKGNNSGEKKSGRLAEATTTTTSTTTTTTTTEPTTTTTAEVPSSSRASSEKPSFRISDDLRFEEQQKQSDVPDEQVDDVQIQSNNAQVKDTAAPQQQQQQQDQEREETPVYKQNQQQQQQQDDQLREEEVKSTKGQQQQETSAAKKGSDDNNQSIGRLRSANSIESEDSSDGSGSGSGSSSESSGDSDDMSDDGFDLLRSNPLTGSSSSYTCSPKAGSSARISADLESMSLKEYARYLNADALFSKLPGSEEMLQSMLDFANSGYTLFLPSNEAVNRLPKQLIKRLKDDKEELRKMIENHVSEDKRQMSNSMSAMSMSSRVTSGRLRINRASSETILVNGNRIISMNNRGPAGGSVHVLDGLLYPVADKNLMETMKSCNRFDGFVTLAEGTGLGDTLSSGGPYTVFVPSNEALQKIPDVDLERIRNNMTALKEFLMFHVAQGSFYSHDLRDGQFIPSLIPDQDIQVGVRVDGCNRRLVEANVSPLYRADIPASNGVIHVIDWILKPNDRDWCEGTVLPRRR